MMPIYRLLSIIIVCLFLSQFAYSATYKIPKNGDNVVGKVIVTKIKRGDTLLTIANRYGIGAHEILEANANLSPSRLRVGQEIIIPTQYVLPVTKDKQKGIVINIPELRLYYFTPDGEYVLTYPVGLGRTGWRTPTTTTRVVKKAVDPPWNVPKSIREYTLWKTGEELPNIIYPGDPKHPLGTRAMYLGLNGYLIHGTNADWTVGRLISSGCIRMHNKDVEDLYELINLGTPVQILHQPHKAGWLEGVLYLESHVPVGSNKGLYEPEGISLQSTIDNATKKHVASINWDNVEHISKLKKGVPQPIGRSPKQP